MVLSQDPLNAALQAHFRNTVAGLAGNSAVAARLSRKMSQIRLNLFRLITAICLSAVSGRRESNVVFDVAIENPPSPLTYEKEDPA